MYIHRGILLVILMMFIFSPTAQEWISNNNAQWYRPFIGWSVIIFMVFFSQRRFSHRVRNKTDV